MYKNKKIGENLRKARKSLGEKDVSSFVKKLETSKAALNRIERGESSYKLLNNYLLFLREKGYDLNAIYDITED